MVCPTNAAATCTWHREPASKVVRGGRSSKLGVTYFLIANSVTPSSRLCASVSRPLILQVVTGSLAFLKGHFLGT